MKRKMPTWLTRQPCAAFVLLSTSAIGVAPALADEGGVSFWRSGSYGSFAAVQSEPGWALSVTDYFAATSAGSSVAQSREIRIGGIPAGLSATLNANYRDRYGVVSVEPTYVFAT